MAAAHAFTGGYGRCRADVRWSCRTSVYPATLRDEIVSVQSPRRAKGEPPSVGGPFFAFTRTALTAPQCAID